MTVGGAGSSGADAAAFDIAGGARVCMARWIACDIDGAMELCGPDVVYSLNIDQEVFAFAGEAVGRPAVHASFKLLRKEFDYLVVRPKAYLQEGDTVRIPVEFFYRHRASGETLSGTMRLVLTWHDGLIRRIDEFADAALVEAFVRLFSPFAAGRRRESKPV